MASEAAPAPAGQDEVHFHLLSKDGITAFSFDTPAVHTVYTASRAETATCAAEADGAHIMAMGYTSGFVQIFQADMIPSFLFLNASEPVEHLAWSADGILLAIFYRTSFTVIAVSPRPELVYRSGNYENLADIANVHVSRTCVSFTRHATITATGEPVDAHFLHRAQFGSAGITLGVACVSLLSKHIAYVPQDKTVVFDPVHMALVCYYCAFRRVVLWSLPLFGGRDVPEGTDVFDMVCSLRGDVWIVGTFGLMYVSKEGVCKAWNTTLRLPPHTRLRAYNDECLAFFHPEPTSNDMTVRRFVYDEPTVAILPRGEATVPQSSRDVTLHDTDGRFNVNSRRSVLMYPHTGRSDERLGWLQMRAEAVAQTTAIGNLRNSAGGGVIVDEEEDHDEDSDYGEGENGDYEDETEEEEGDGEEDGDGVGEDETEEENDVVEALEASRMYLQPLRGPQRIIAVARSLVAHLDAYANVCAPSQACVRAWVSLAPKEQVDAEIRKFETALEQVGRAVDMLQTEIAGFANFFFTSTRVGVFDARIGEEDEAGFLVDVETMDVVPREPLAVDPQFRAKVLCAIVDDMDASEFQSVVTTAVVPTLNAMVSQLRDCSRELQRGLSRLYHTTIVENDEALPHVESDRKRRRREECMGCAINHPSQRHHTCLSEGSEDEV